MSNGKKRSRFVSAAMRSNAQANAAKHDWAREAAGTRGCGCRGVGGPHGRCVVGYGNRTGVAADNLHQRRRDIQGPEALLSRLRGGGACEIGARMVGIRRRQAMENLVRTLQGGLSEEQLRGLLRDGPGRAGDVPARVGGPVAAFQCRSSRFRRIRCTNSM